MARRRRTDKAAGSSRSLSARINLLCKLIWGGNRSRMGKDLSVSQPVMSRVLAGRQPPSGKLLEALADWPRVNVNWLFAGKGEPLSDRGLGDGGGHFCPISDQLLLGSPQDHPGLLTSTSLAVATAFFSPTAYFYRLQPQDPLVTSKDTQMTAGDCLLIETATAWTSRLDAFRGRLCVLRDPIGEKLVIGRIGRWERDPMVAEFDYAVDTFGKSRSAVFRPKATRATASAEKVAAGVTLFRGEDLVGVARLLVRLLDPD